MKHSYFNTKIIIILAGLLMSLSVFSQESLPISTVDTVEKKMNAAIDHFSTFLIKSDSTQTDAPKLDNSLDRLLIYPNPFGNSTKISFKVESASLIKLGIYNIVGQKIISLTNDYYSKGIHSVSWDGTNDSGILCDPGIYFCRMSKNGRQSVIKKILYHR